MLADVFFWAVKKWGSDPFSEAQMDACNCCM